MDSPPSQPLDTVANSTVYCDVVDSAWEQTGRLKAAHERDLILGGGVIRRRAEEPKLNRSGTNGRNRYTNKGGRDDKNSMYRRVLCLLLLPCVLLTQSASLGHCHGDTEPAGHDLRPHFHTNLTSSCHGHHGHHRHGPGGHHHHDDAD